MTAGTAIPRSASSLTTASNGSTLVSSRSHEDAATSESTPLLRSNSTSPTLRSNHSSNKDDDSQPDLIVSTARALCISLSMWALMFLQAANISGMTMVQGHIADDLKAYEHAMWFTSVFLIVSASSAPLVGRFATIFALRYIVLCAALFFAVGAVVTAKAASLPVFLFGRVLSGIAGGSIMTLSLIMVLQLTSRKRRGLFIGMVNAGFTVGVSCGAVVFGALLPVLGWRLLFLVQAPLGLVAGVGVYLSLPNRLANSDEQQQHDGHAIKDKTTLQKLKAIDYLGAATLTASIVLFLYGLSGTIQPLPMLLSLLVLAFFVLHEYKLAADPLIPVAVLQSRGVLFSCLAQLGLMAARWTVLYYTPIFVLAVRGLSPAIAGAVLIPTNIGFAIGGVLVGWLHVRRAGSFYLPCLVCILFFAASLELLATAVSSSPAATPAWAYVLVVFGNGFATGATLNYTLAHLLHVAAPGTHYVATGLLATFRGFAGSFGTSIGGGVFARRLGARLTEGFARLDGHEDGGGGVSPERAVLIKRLIASPNLVFGGGLSEAERMVAVQGYVAAFKLLYTSAALLAVGVLVVQAATGWTQPRSQETEEQIEEEIAEADGRMEA